ncbi:flagellar basal body rod protein [Bacillus songklensis]|uniref:Flagellar basal body rod protein n=1 Tax=Bacillus songklensis TaxID=1069116 RepID=A0ABV8B2M4_9BACI
MKKFGLLLLGGIAAAVLFTHLAPMIALAIGLVVLYFAIKQFFKAETTFRKVLWSVIGFIALMATASNVPAIIGVAAAYILYIVYKKWNDNKEIVKEESDPFVNFEKQWAELKRN